MIKKTQLKNCNIKSALTKQIDCFYNLKKVNNEITEIAITKEEFA